MRYAMLRAHQLSHVATSPHNQSDVRIDPLTPLAVQRLAMYHHVRVLRAVECLRTKLVKRFDRATAGTKNRSRIYT